MNIAELFLDKIASTKLFEMARSRQEAKGLFTSLSPQIFTHLIKLFVFNSPKNKKHWIREIDGWLRKLDEVQLKPSNKKPDWQTTYNWIVFDASPHYDNEYIVGRVDMWLKTDYKNVKVYDYDPGLVLNQILKIIELVTKDMSIANKFITIKDYLDYKHFGVEE